MLNPRAHQQSDRAPHADSRLTRVERLPREGSNELGEDEGQCDATHGHEHRTSAIADKEQCGGSEVSVEHQADQETHQATVEEHLEIRVMRVVDVGIVVALASRVPSGKPCALHGSPSISNEWSFLDLVDDAWP